jgi:hypothetical protein
MRVIRADSPLITSVYRSMSLSHSCLPSIFRRMQRPNKYRTSHAEPSRALEVSQIVFVTASYRSLDAVGRCRYGGAADLGLQPVTLLQRQPSSQFVDFHYQIIGRSECSELRVVSGHPMTSEAKPQTRKHVGPFASLVHYVVSPRLRRGSRLDGEEVDSLGQDSRPSRLLEQTWAQWKENRRHRNLHLFRCVQKLNVAESAMNRLAPRKPCHALLAESAKSRAR